MYPVARLLRTVSGITHQGPAATHVDPGEESSRQLSLEENDESKIMQHSLMQGYAEEAADPI
jgi:hypothetical protein